MITPVRCCCQPKKLLGFLPRTGDSRTHHFLTLEGKRIELPLAQYYEVDKIGEKRIEIAFKAEGLRIQTLEKIPGFKKSSNKGGEE